MLETNIFPFLRQRSCRGKATTPSPDERQKVSVSITPFGGRRLKHSPGNYDFCNILSEKCAFAKNEIRLST